MTVDTIKNLGLNKKDQRVACGPKVKKFKLHELWASSQNGCLSLQLMSYREIIKNLTTYGYNFQYGCVLTVKKMTPH